MCSPCCIFIQPEAHSSLSSADVETFRAQLAAVLQLNASQSEENHQLREENRRLQAKVESKDKQLAEALRLLFGSRSKRFLLAPGPQQGALFEEVGIAVPPPPEAETNGQQRKRRKPRRVPTWTICRATCPARRS